MVSTPMERALEFLRNHKDVALATCEECSSAIEGNGQNLSLPKLRIFQIMKQEGNLLYFATSERKAVWHELRKNQNVEILAYADQISVRCSGMVNFNVDDATKRWIFEHNDVLQRLYASYDQIVYFCLPIAEMDYYDLKPTPPLFLHYDLMAGEMTSH